MAKLFVLTVGLFNRISRSIPSFRDLMLREQVNLVMCNLARPIKIEVEMKTKNAPRIRGVCIFEQIMEVLY